MTISTKCSCGQQYDLADELAGKKARCRACRNVFIVPDQNSVVKSNPPHQPNVIESSNQHPNFGASFPNQTPPSLPASSPNFQPPQTLPQQSLSAAATPVSPANAAQPMQMQPMAPHAELPYRNPASIQATNGINKKLFWIVGGVTGALIVCLVIGFVLSGDHKKTKDSDAGTGKEIALSRDDRAKLINEKYNNTGVPGDPVNSAQNSGKPTRSGSNEKSNSRPTISPEELIPRSQNNVVKKIHNETLVSKYSPDVAASRSGKFLVIDPTNSNKRRRLLVDLDKPDQPIELGVLDATKIIGVSNDGTKLFLDRTKKSGGSFLTHVFVWDRTTNEELYWFKNVRDKAQLSFSCDSEEVLIDDTYATVVLSMDKTKEPYESSLVWAQHRTLRSHYEWSWYWTSDLRYAYHTKDEKIYRLDELDGKYEEVVIQGLNDPKLDFKCFSRNAKFGVYKSETRIISVDLSTLRVGNSIKTPEVGRSSQFSISDDGSVICFSARGIPGDPGMESISIVDTENETVVDRIISREKISKFVLSANGRSIVTFDEAGDERVLCSFFDTGLGGRNSLNANIESFARSVPNSQIAKMTDLRSRHDIGKYIQMGMNFNAKFNRNK